MEYSLTPAGKIKRTIATLLVKESEDEKNYRQNLGNNILDEFASRLRCTKCSADYSSAIKSGKSFNIHPLLNVFFCKKCNEFYGDGEFSLDEDDEDKYCRWCGEGGTLFLCSTCICGFCPKCIKRNLGHEQLQAVRTDDNWQCFICVPKPLWHLRSLTKLALEYSESLKQKKIEEDSDTSKAKKPKNAFEHGASALSSLRQGKRKGVIKSSSSSDSDHNGKSYSTRLSVMQQATLKSNQIKTLSSDGLSSRRAGKTLQSRRFNCSSSSSDDDEPLTRKRKRERKKSKGTTLIEIANDKPEEKSTTISASKKGSPYKIPDNLKSPMKEKLKSIANALKALHVMSSVCQNSTERLLDEVANARNEAAVSRLTKKVNQIIDLCSMIATGVQSQQNGSMKDKQVLACSQEKTSENDSREVQILQEFDNLENKNEISVLVEKISKKIEILESSQSSSDKVEQIVSSQDFEPSEHKGKESDNEVKCKQQQKENGASDDVPPDIEKMNNDEVINAPVPTATDNTSYKQQEEAIRTNTTHESSLKDKISSNDKSDVADVLVRVEDDNMDENDAIADGLSPSAGQLSRDMGNTGASNLEESDNIEGIGNDQEQLLGTKAAGHTCNADTDYEALQNTPGTVAKQTVLASSSESVIQSSEKETSDSSILSTLCKSKKKRKGKGIRSLKGSGKRERDTDNIKSLTNLASLNRSRKSKLNETSEEEKESKITRTKERKKKTKEKEQTLLDMINELCSTSCGEEEEEEAEPKETLLRTLSKSKDILKDLILGTSSSDDDDNNNNNDDVADNDHYVKSEDSTKVKKSPTQAKPSSKKRKYFSSMSDSSVAEGKRNQKKRKHSSRSVSEDDEKKPPLKKKKASVNRSKSKNWFDDHSSSSDSELEVLSQNTTSSSKGRKNIKKVMKEDMLHVETKAAVRLEEERKNRIVKRRNEFNKLFEKESKRLILDFNEDGEVLVEVSPRLVKKLKPHQKEGVKFMWDNCFESLSAMENSNGGGCILAHCMGLGKTLQVVTLLHTVLTQNVGVETALVVCPLNTVSNWISEIEMWLAVARCDIIDVYDLNKYRKNDERRFQLKTWHEEGGIMVISYDMYRNLTKRSKGILEAALVRPGPDVVVCDEGHLLKNEDSVLSRCISKIQTARRIVLTGTPLQNNLKEYHCMVQFIKPNILGTKKEFMNRFVNPIHNGQFGDSTARDVVLMKRRSHVLHAMLDGCIQRFDYSVLTPFLPAKHEYVIKIALAEPLAKLYRHYVDTLSGRANDSNTSATLFHDFQALQRIWTHPVAMQAQFDKHLDKKAKEQGKLTEEEDFVDDRDEDEISIHDSGSESASNSDSSVTCLSKSGQRRRGTRANPVSDEENQPELEKEKPWWDSMIDEKLFEDECVSGKLVILFSILNECAAIQDKVLVFSQSLFTLDLIEHFLNQKNEAGEQWELGSHYFRLDGSSSSEKRTAWCKTFNREDNKLAKLFLISTRAGGLGINLVAANRVVIFDVSWNPSHDMQSIFRIYRFGQKKPCFIYRLVSEATMEEKIYERQVTKLSLAGRVVDEHQIERHYTMGNLMELYRFEPLPREKWKTPIFPKDDVLAKILKNHEDILVSYHEHDSLLENKEEEELTEDERKKAWEDYEAAQNAPPKDLLGEAFYASFLKSQTSAYQAAFDTQQVANQQLTSMMKQMLRPAFFCRGPQPYVAGPSQRVANPYAASQSKHPSKYSDPLDLLQKPSFNQINGAELLNLGKTMKFLPKEGENILSYQRRMSQHWYDIVQKTTSEVTSRSTGAQPSPIVCEIDLED